MMNDRIVSMELVLPDGRSYTWERGRDATVKQIARDFEFTVSLDPSPVEDLAERFNARWEKFIAELRDGYLARLRRSPMRKKLDRIAQDVQATPHHYGCYPDISPDKSEVFEEIVHAARRRYPRYP